MRVSIFSPLPVGNLGLFCCLVSPFSDGLNQSLIFAQKFGESSWELLWLSAAGRASLFWQGWQKIQ
jgi:hypothetical protein